MKTVLFVQMGDFRSAYLRLGEGTPEIYRDQNRSVEFVADLARHHRIVVVSFGERREYRERLGPNLEARGMVRDGLERARIRAVLDEIAPTHVILRTPHVGFLREIVRRRVHLLPVFADIFENDSVKGLIRNIVIRRALRASRSPCFSNHSLNASKSFHRALRLPRDRIVPWDWSPVPISGKAKLGVADESAPTAFFAGALTQKKGVGDCIDAISLLKDRGIRLRMTFAGNGDVARWTEKARLLNVLDQVQFVGLVPNAEVRSQMRAHDFVVVPSHHAYAEGLPNTIYEGLAARSVLIVSDHPAFAGRLDANRDALVFPAGNPAALADTIDVAVRDPGLYRRLSENSKAAHDRLYVGMEWTALIAAFLDDPEDATGWVGQNVLPDELLA